MKKTPKDIDKGKEKTVDAGKLTYPEDNTVKEMIEVNKKHSPGEMYRQRYADNNTSMPADRMVQKIPDIVEEGRSFPEDMGSQDSRFKELRKFLKKVK